MAKWRNRAQIGLQDGFKQVQEDRLRRGRNRLAQRSLRIETFEERTLFVIGGGPDLIAVIPNEGTVINTGDKVTIAPRELTIRFDDGQKIDATTLSNITVTRAGFDDLLGNSNDVAVPIGFVGIGEKTNEVILRFAESLPDDKYRVRITGGLKNTAGDAFHKGVAQNVDFDLDLGAQVVAVVPQPITRSGNALSQASDNIEVYFNNDDLSAAAATNKNFYELIRTSDTASNIDDTVVNPISVVYDNLTDKATLTFAVGVLETAGTYRLRIGNNDPLPVAPQNIAVPTDPGSTLSTAKDLGTLFTGSAGFQSAQLTSSIDPQLYSIMWPGGQDMPGHREIPVQGEDHVALDSGDTVDGVPTLFYNFMDVYGADPTNGQPLHNLITENQKQRTREILSLYSKYAGVQFVESADSGFTVVTGDLRALDPLIPTGPGGVAGLAGGGMAIMDLAENWGNSEYGGSWQQVAMHEIGHVLGLGHTYDLPALTIMGSSEGAADPSQAAAETVLPGDGDIVHMRYLYRPDVKDIDTYKFSLSQNGTLSLETVAQRLTTNSTEWLDSVISLYDSSGKLIARNDNYFGKDSFVKLDLKAGDYYAIITASGNTSFDPTVPDSGMGGRSQGQYQLKFDFTPAPSGGLTDATGTLFDGDADGKPGGTYNFWFKTQTAAHTIYVDKAFGGAAPDGTLAKPLTNIGLAMAKAKDGDIVRIVGNNFANDGGTTPVLTDNLSYNIGYDILGNSLTDGTTMEVPKGVTVMIDAGAVFKLRSANIDVGSSAQGIDRSRGALQVLGTPTNSVYFTSWHDETLGKDIDIRPTTATRGDWGGLVFRKDSDMEDQGIFLDYVNHADMRYGGGQVVVNSIQDVFDPIHMIESRPTVSFNTITKSADAAMSGDPNSFEETRFQDNTYAADYGRVGPDIHGNKVTDNSINGLFIRIKTDAGKTLDPLTKIARFDDTDIVHVFSENLLITGDAGGGTLDDTSGTIVARQNAQLSIDPGVVVKLGGARIETQMGAQFLAEGTAANPIIFTGLLDDRYGRGGTFDTTNDGSGSSPSAGDWAGFFFAPTSFGSIDHALITYAGGSSAIEGGFANFDPIEIMQAEVRVAHSTLEHNANGADGSNRNGRLGNTGAVIFVRGAQPKLIGNVIRNNAAAAISINANALNDELNNDTGRSTGGIDLAGDFFANYGPLVTGNMLDKNTLNGMVVRGGTLTAGSIWDDTDIVHILQDEIVVPNLHVYGGIRLQSTPGHSLVVKLQGQNAGFTASGKPLEINDRIGGTVQILGTADAPVVLTGLSDDTVGAGFTPDGKPQTDTDGNGNTASTTLPTIPDVANGTIIDNNTATDTVGHFQLDVQNGGGADFSGQNGLTAQGNTQKYINENLIFGYTNYVDVGSDGGAISLATTTITQAAKLIAPDTVESKGSFAGANGLITWTVTTKVLPGETKATNTVVFASAQPLGNLRLINYLDEDIDGVGDDILRTVGTPGQADFLVYTLDGPERVGFAQGGVYTAGTGLVNAKWDGWAADQYSQLKTAITGTGTTYTPAGNIDLTDLPSSTDPALGTVYGPNDVTTAFAWTVDATATSSTVTTYLQGVATNPGIASGQWRGIKLDKYSNDRNVAIVNELEQGFTAQGDVNGRPNTAQFMGTLAPNLNSGDDNSRLGFDVHGAVSQTFQAGSPARQADVDVYSFKATAGTQVWLDIDRSTVAFDSIVELVDANGSVIARSNDSTAELAAADPITGNSPLLVGAIDKTKVLQADTFHGTDFYTTNPRDAGMRVVLPGTTGASSTYYVRVRANSGDLTNLTGGQSYGTYDLQVRLQETDEFAGSTVQFADIRYATNAVEVLGKPEHSPLIGESTSTGANHTTFGTAQDLGNLLAVDRNTLATAGMIASEGQVDWYKFNVDYQAIQSIAGVNDKGSYWSTVFDLDYADGTGRVNASMAVFDGNGNLVYWNRNGSPKDDLPGPFAGADTTDLTRGSFGSLDPYIGSVDLKEGNGQTYYVAVSSNAYVPLELSQFTDANAANKLFRLEPLAEYNRIFSNRVESSTANAQQTITLTPDAFHLGDVTMFVNTPTELYTVDPLTGMQETDVTGPNVNLLDTTGSPFVTYNDLSMRNDGRLYTITQGNGDTNLDQLALSGNYRELNTGNGTLNSSVDDGLTTFQIDPFNATPTLVKSNSGIQFEALAQIGDSARNVYAVGNFPTLNNGMAVTRNILYKLRGDGVVSPDPNTPPRPVSAALQPTDIRQRGELFTAPTIIPVPATDVIGDNTDPGYTNPNDVLDGLTFTLQDVDGTTKTFEMDSGVDIAVSSFGAAAVRDGNTFKLGDGSTTKTFEFESGPVLVVKDGANLVDGDTFAVTDSAGNVATFVFDNDGKINTGEKPIAFKNTDSLLTVMGNTVAAINGGGIGVAAGNSPLANFAGRITLTGDKALALGLGTTSATIAGQYGQQTPGSVLIPYEETDSFTTLATSILSTVNANLTLGRSGFADRTGSPQVPPAERGDRITFFGGVATAADLAGTPALSLTNGVSGASKTGVTGTNIAIPFDADDNAADLANLITATINFTSQTNLNFTITAQQFGGQVELTGAAPNANQVVNGPFALKGNGPGGLIKGMAYVGATLYAVSDTGGLYTVQNPDNYESSPGIGGPSLTYIATSTDLLGKKLTGLSVGPQNVEGGKYANLLFATDSSGNIYAFDTTGKLQPIFLNGATSLSTGIANLQGLAFSTLDSNLWHATTNRGGDAGHSIPADPTIPSSYYFGFQDKVSPGSTNYEATGQVPFGPDGNPSMFNTYDMPGGAYGSLTTSPFSLAGYTVGDQPTFYYTYYYDAEANTLHDTARVFISQGGGDWTLLQENPFRNTSSWRQSRIDLGAFAGLDNLRLRFDFSTAGDMEVGNNSYTGEILRALDGNTLRDGQTFTIDGKVFEINLGPTAIVQSAPMTTDGDTITINGTIFEFNTTGGVVGGHKAVNVASTDSAATVATTLAAAITAAGIGVTPHVHGARVDLENAVTATRTGTSASIDGAAGVTGTNVAINITSDSTAAQVATTIATAMDKQFVTVPANDVAGFFQSVKVDGDLLHVIGHNVSSAGPLPFSKVLSGDHPVPAIPDRFTDPARGQDNHHEGLYLDDFIIGLAARGEMSLFASGASTYIQDPTRPSPDPNINVGNYDLEIRRGTEPARTKFDPFPVDPDPIGHTAKAKDYPVAIDFRTRQDQQITMSTLGGSAITEGDLFRITDGLTAVTFEFDSNGTVGSDTLQDGTVVKHVAVSYTSQSTTGQVATTIANAINTRYQSSSPSVFKVRATASGTDGRVELINAADVDNGTGGEISHSIATNKFGEFALGDQNVTRDQGYTLIANNRIFGAAQFGISVDAAARDNADQPHPGSVRNLRELNSQRLVPGVTLYNNLIVNSGTAGIRFSGDAGAAGALGAVPFGRIVNNTIYGGDTAAGIGVLVNDAAGPTILNNILANNITGVQVAADSSATTVLGSNVYKGNTTNRTGAGETFNIDLTAADPLFVDALNRDFYLKSGSKAIDSSLNSLVDRPAMTTVTAPLGIPASPILAPNFDLLGQLRVDDPAVPSPPGLGSNVFKDRGAIDRADFVGPSVALSNPLDNDGTLDQNSTNTQVKLFGQVLATFSVQFTDGTGAGLNNATVVAADFTLKRNGQALAQTTDFLYSYDTTNHVATFTAASGVWANGTYTITINNTATGVRDIADNPLKPNQLDGTVLFTIDLQAAPAAPWQNPVNNYDVDGDGIVVPLDLLLLINKLNSSDPTLSLPATPPPYYDVNGDGNLTPLDALLEIDYLNRQAAGLLGSFESSDTMTASFATSDSTLTDSAFKTTVSDPALSSNVAFAITANSISSPTPVAAASTTTSSVASNPAAAAIIAKVSSALDSVWSKVGSNGGDFSPLDDVLGKVANGISCATELADDGGVDSAALHEILDSMFA